MTETYKKLIATLEEIFQLDQADLDFGIYRIMNQKRSEINDFLQNRLLKQVKETLAMTGAYDSEAIAKELEETLKQARGMGVSDPDELPNEEAFEILKPIIPEAFRSGLLKSMPTASNPGRTLLDSIPV